MLKLTEDARVFVNQKKDASVRMIGVYSHGYAMFNDEDVLVKADFYPEDDNGSAEKIAKLTDDPNWKEVL